MDRVRVIGNLDLNGLGRGKPEETDREVKERIRNPGPGGGYMISSGNSLASYLKPECLLAMAGAIRKYGTYPLRVGRDWTHCLLPHESIRDKIIY
jgi:uroporphyrinogen decarboxylase